MPFELFTSSEGGSFLTAIFNSDIKRSYSFSCSISVCPFLVLLKATYAENSRIALSCRYSKAFIFNLLCVLIFYPFVQNNRPPTSKHIIFLLLILSSRTVFSDTFLSFFLRSPIGGVAYVTVFNSFDTWAATFRLNEQTTKTHTHEKGQLTENTI